MKLKRDSKETQRVFGKALISLSEAFLILFSQNLKYFVGLEIAVSPRNEGTTFSNRSNYLTKKFLEYSRKAFGMLPLCETIQSISIIVHLFLSKGLS